MNINTNTASRNAASATSVSQLVPFVHESEFDEARAVAEARACVQNGHMVMNHMLAEIDPRLLVYDLSYQGSRNTTIDTSKLEKNFNSLAFEAVSVNYRDGLFVAFNGCHRAEYAIKAGFKTILVIITVDQNLNGCSYEREAEAFANQGTGTVEMTQHHTFQGNVIAGDDVDVAIQALCAEKGIVVTRAIGPKSGGVPRLSGLRTARGIVRNHGAACLKWCVETVEACGWLNQQNSLSHPVLESMRRIYVKADGDAVVLDEYRRKLKASLLGFDLNHLCAELNAAWPHTRSDNRTRLPLLVECVANGSVLLDATCNLPLVVQLSGYKDVTDEPCPRKRPDGTARPAPDASGRTASRHTSAKPRACA